MVCLQSQHSVGVVTIACLQCFPDTPCLVWNLLFCSCFVVCVLDFLYIYFAYNITWFVVYLFIAMFVFVLDITWCMYYKDYGFYFGGGSYSSVYVPPPLFVFPVVLIVCVPAFFSPPCYVLCAYFFIHICPWFSFCPLCEFYPHLDENLWGGVHMLFIICSHMWILKCVYLTYFIMLSVDFLNNRANFC